MQVLPSTESEILWTRKPEVCTVKLTTSLDRAGIWLLACVCERVCLEVLSLLERLATPLPRAVMAGMVGIAPKRHTNNQTQNDLFQEMGQQFAT